MSTCVHHLTPEIEETRRTTPETRPPGVDMDVDKNVPIPMRDGLELAANVYRPTHDREVPIIMAFTGFGKDLPWNGTNPGWGITTEPYQPTITGTTSFEAPEPAFWTSHDYAVVVVDPRGEGRSPGEFDADEMNLFARDIYDAIEWGGEVDWSNGNVGMSGVSFLGFTQWRPASMNPPHLKAINPWEAFTDFHRDTKTPGGIPETGFHADDEGADVPQDPAWKGPDEQDPPAPWDREEDDFLSDIEVPAFICGTWGDQGYHTRGTFRAFRKIASEHKWLYTHGRQKWAEFYSSEARTYRRMFFDHFLKGTDSRILDTPRVRLEVRETLNDYTVRYEDDFPVPDTEYREFYLDASEQTLSETLPSDTASTSYESSSEQTLFDLRFDEETELTGYMRLKLWVSPEDATDMDLFVTLRKLDSHGNEVYFDDCIALSRWPVAVGWLRLSHRELDEDKSTPWEPYPKHVLGEGDPVEPGDVVPCEIAIPPSSTLFRTGETLRVSVSGLYQGGERPEHDWLTYDDTVNEGNHTIYTGGDYDSSLLVPHQPSR